MNTRPTLRSGFTIVELLVAMVVIAILAVISIVSYNNIQKKVVVSSIQADLATIDRKIKLYVAEHDRLPTAIACPTSQTTEICTELSGKNKIFSYHVLDNQSLTYSVTVKNGEITYKSGSGVDNSLSAELTAVTNGLQGYYDAGDSSSYSLGSSAWGDLSGNNKNATLTNITSAGTGTKTQLIFDRTSSLVNIPAMPTQSIFMSVYLDSTQSPPYYLLDSRPGNSGGYIFSNGTGNWKNFKINLVASNANLSSIPKGQWLTFYAETDSLYSSDINIFSRYSKSEKLSGKIRAILVYNRKLSSAEITQNQDYFNSRTAD